MLLRLVVGTVFALAAMAQTVLDNGAIIRMVKAGLSDDLVVSTIKAQPGTYSTKPDDLIALKNAGVSEKVIAAMMAGGPAAAAPVASVPAAAPAAAPETADMPKDVEIGVYYKKGGRWEEMLPEVVNWKTGGVMKHIATAGVVKGDVNGHIQNPHSRNSVALPIEVLIYTPEGVAITEYQLLHLHENSDNREFRTVTGGVMHVSGGATRDQIPFEGKKVAPRTYKVLLPTTLGAGEFGFLPPGGSMSSSNTSLGKMYTFRILE